ncbi:ATPase, AAA [Candidatus Magnetomorum sp. HK-1]|nr:ATPase, AAA [Candidatus Magnetomorum sp. HK-1]
MTHPNPNYEGQGQTNKELKPYKGLADTMKPEHYLASPGLRHAVNVALTLGQPLLITGEPGTGKTQLAYSIAYEFSRLPDKELPLFKFHVKSTSVAQDLFYQYDAIRRFQDSHDKDKTIDPKNYVDFKALGLAILLTQPDKAKEYIPQIYQKYLHQGRPTRSIILLDEIDKAPRDLPNDILVEIEKMEFSVKEVDRLSFKAKMAYRPIVVITSNSEKNLPDAFLRRCVYYHIPFPDPDTLKRIIKTRFQDDPTMKPHLTDDFIDVVNKHFTDIRNQPDFKKKPATAELLAWFSILLCIDLNLDPLLNELSKPEPDIKKFSEQFVATYSVLAKTQSDLDRIGKLVEKDLKDKNHVYQIITILNDRLKQRK